MGFIFFALCFVGFSWLNLKVTLGSQIQCSLLTEELVDKNNIKKKKPL